MIVYAASASELINKLIDLFVAPIILLIYSVAVFLFFWGLLRFITDPTNPEKRKTGVMHIIWGLVGLIIITTVYGILTLIANFLGVELPGPF